VFKTLEKELEEGGLKGLTPIDRVDVAEGMAVGVVKRDRYGRRLTVSYPMK
jgi:hypothetical protein